MSLLKYGDSAARLVSGRIGASVATTALLTAIPAASRVDGMLCLAGSQIYRFELASTAAGGGILTPDAGTGKWIPIGGAAFAGSRAVRGVCYANMSISAFVGVLGGTAQDGLTYAAGERVLLANQTTAAQNGIYVVGTVATGTAPLTRVTDFFTGDAIVNGARVEASEGTLWAGSSWKAMCTGAKIVGTDDAVFTPRICKGILTLASGTYTLGSTEGLFLFSVTRSVVKAGFNTAGGTVSSTVNWRCASAGRTAGKSGTAAATIIATIAAGTIDTANNSTMDWEVSNW